MKSAEDKCKWIVDPEAAAVVRRIFQLTMEAKGPYQICCILKEEKVPMPAYYLAQKGAGLHQKYSFPDPHNWSSSTVCGILSKKEYLGHTVNFKTRKGGAVTRRLYRSDVSPPMAAKPAAAPTRHFAGLPESVRVGHTLQGNLPR